MLMELVLRIINSQMDNNTQPVILTIIIMAKFGEVLVQV